MADTMLDDLSAEMCIDLLRAGGIGRVAVVADGFPVVLPVNYRLVEQSQKALIVVRTRPGNVIDQGDRVAFQIDGVDPFHQTGWSVLVQGTLHHLDDVAIRLLGEHVDPKPWLHEGRDAWLLIKPERITGRRLRTADLQWAFHLRGYL